MSSTGIIIEKNMSKVNTHEKIDKSTSKPVSFKVARKNTFKAKVLDGKDAMCMFCEEDAYDDGGG
jgi:hypothetical protein